MVNTSYYTILQIPPTADVHAIKQAYRAQIRQYHPDKFAARRSQLMQSGDRQALTVLDQQIEQAKYRTQKINEAYATLTDPDKRAAYDRVLSQQRMARYEQEIYRQRTRNPDYGRRTVKARPHRRRPPAAGKPDAVPVMLLAGLLIAALLGFSIISRAILPRQWFSSVYIPPAPTSEHALTSHQLQATQNAEQETSVARTQTANNPTATPLDAATNERSADALYALGNYHYAADLYSRAIELNPDTARLYLKRGQAYVHVFRTGSDAAAQLALDDFEQGLALDNGTAEIYRERGLLLFDLWQVNPDTILADRVIADLEWYTSLAPDTEVETALVILYAAMTGD